MDAQAIYIHPKEYDQNSCMEKSHKTLKLCHTDYALIVLSLLSEQHRVITIYILLRVRLQQAL